MLTSDFKILAEDFYLILNKLIEWDKEILEEEIRTFVNNKDIKFILFGKPMRLLLTNQENGPSISDILYILGKKISIKRINDYISNT